MKVIRFGKLGTRFSFIRIKRYREINFKFYETDHCKGFSSSFYWFKIIFTWSKVTKF